MIHVGVLQRDEEGSSKLNISADCVRREWTVNL